jgi:hypothetical protein
MKDWNNDLTECPEDTLVWVICDNYKRYKVAKLCSHCGIWADEDGEPVFDVTDWKPYLTPSANKANTDLDKIIDAWLDDHYDINHKQNSLRKHLNVDRVQDCMDFELKKKYWAYLSRGDDMP